MSPDARFAIYFAPQPESALARRAANWFAHADSQPYTVFPRHYGFHATLKPPFALTDGHTPDDLRRALRAFAAEQAPLILPPLSVTLLGSFIALTLEQPSEKLNALADGCVEQFDHFRRPAARSEEGLSPRQLEHLARWGYPYVFDQWQFHMTLTSSVKDETVRATLLETLVDYFTPALATPVPVTDLCLFFQPDRATPFKVTDRYPCLGK